VQKLGLPPHVCVFCGYSDPMALIAKSWAWVANRVPPKVLQEHHVVGRQLDGQLIVLLCMNCHGLVHRRYLDEGIDLRAEPNPRIRVVRMLRARAAFARLDAERLDAWADQLDDRGTEHENGPADH
jgi:hypothetical protein